MQEARVVGMVFIVALLAVFSKGQCPRGGAADFQGAMPRICDLLPEWRIEDEADADA